MPHYYPIYLNLKGKPCLLVGGGEAAARKAMELLAAGAELKVVSPGLAGSFPRSDRLQFHPRAFRPSDLDGVFLAISAAEDMETNRQVYEAALDRGVLVNVVDVPQMSHFIAPAIFRRGPLCVAVSSSGTSPSLSSRLARMMPQWIGPEYADYLELLGGYRREILRTVGDREARTRLLKRLSEQDMIDLMREKGRPAAEQRIRQLIEESTRLPLT